MRRVFKNEGELTLITDLLTTYQRQGENRKWDDFRYKIPDNLLKLWGDLIIECRRNGFIGPRAEGDRITWMQVIGTNDIRNGDLCTMCDRGCSKREKIDSGEAKRMKIINPDYQQDKKCWM